MGSCPGTPATLTFYALRFTFDVPQVPLVAIDAVAAVGYKGALYGVAGEFVAAHAYEGVALPYAGRVLGGVFFGNADRREGSDHVWGAETVESLRERTGGYDLADTLD